MLVTTILFWGVPNDLTHAALVMAWLGSSLVEPCKRQTGGTRRTCLSKDIAPHFQEFVFSCAHVARSNWSGQSSNNIINSCLDRVQDRYREGLQPSQQFAGKRPQAAADIKVADHTWVCLKIGISWNTLSFGILYGYLIGKNYDYIYNYHNLS